MLYIRKKRTFHLIKSSPTDILFRLIRTILTGKTSVMFIIPNSKQINEFVFPKRTGVKTTKNNLNSLKMSKKQQEHKSR